MEDIIAGKVKLLTKKIQDRKTAEIFHNTYITQDEIKDILEMSEVQQPLTPNNEILITFLCSMRSIAHTKQSQVRWADFVKRQGGDESIYTFSSKGDYQTVTQITDRLTSKTPPKHIIMCTHPKRISDLKFIAKFLDERNDELKRPRRLRIYADEMDKYIDDMHDDFNEILSYQCVKALTVVTATPGPIWKYWPRMFDLTPSITGGEDTYLMFKDCIHVSINSLTLHEYIQTNMGDTVEKEKAAVLKEEDKRILTIHNSILHEHSNIREKGRIIFAPGNMTRRSHDLIAKFWNDKGCAAIVINGERTNDGFYGYLLLPDKTVVDVPHMRLKDFKSDAMKTYVKTTDYKNLSLSTSAQLNDILADLYHVHGLKEFALVITGLLCVQRAQSLMHPEWGTFTDVINANKPTSPEDAYQQQRQMGHIRKWETFKGLPRVFSFDKDRQDIEILERRAHNFSVTSYENGVTFADYCAAGADGKSEVIPLTSSETKLANREIRQKIRNTIQQSPALLTRADVNSFLQKIFGKPFDITSFITRDGFELSTRLNSHYRKKKEHLVAEDRLTNEKFARINIALNISSKTGQQYMVYPVYPTMTSPPEDLVYYVRYLPPSSDMPSQ